MMNQYEIDYKQGYDTANDEWLERIGKIRAEIEKLNPVDYGSMFSYESHNGAKYMKDDVLRIIDRYKAESEGNDNEDIPMEYFESGGRVLKND